MQSITGQVVRGYELSELIGVGGFGAVYRAYQPAVKRDVAIKIILPHYANQPDFIRSFETEAQLVARLEHIHIVPLYDYWREPNGAFLVMRWLRGGSLRGKLQSGPLDFDTAATVLDQVASALTVAHRRGVVHRDIKPDNILLDEDGNSYLTDFGIAMDLNTQRGRDDEVFAGSLTYTSPEQVRGETPTPLTDIYSTGILLYEMLTGEHPFPSAQAAALVFKHLNDPLPEIHKRYPDFSPEIDLVIQRATAKAPDARYPDPLTLSAAFRRSIKLSRRRLTVSDMTAQPAIRIDTTPTPFNAVLPEIETPYKGLRAFQEADAAEFYGRETLVEHLLRRMSGTDVTARFLAVVGPSGSGKSSVVKAGVVPALRSGALPGSRDWFIIDMVPGARPYDELTSALLGIAIDPPDGLRDLLMSDEHGLAQAISRVVPDESGQVVLVIDQFEELFTQIADEDVQAQFLKTLYNAVVRENSPFRLIVTLRADFYDRPLMYAGFGDLMRQCTEVVLPLQADELQRAIVEPASRVGVELEPGLVTMIIKDVSEQPGALPLLQYALTELFERRQGPLLRLHSYDDIGGVLGALARRAEELYTSLDEVQQRAVRQLFLRLVTPGEEGDHTRRRVTRLEVTSVGDDEASMEAAIDTFGKSRLLTFDRDPITRAPTVEVAHEALIRQWERLKEWLEENREDLRQQRKLTAGAEEWLASGRDPSYLMRGIRLEQLEAWLATTSLALSQDERAFISASVSDRAQRLAEIERQQEREAALERRSRDRLRILLVVMLLATIGALFLWADASNQRQIAVASAATASFAQSVAEANAVEASNQRQIAEASAATASFAQSVAEANAVEARSLAQAASSQLSLQDGNGDLAVLLALEANRVVSPLQAQLALADVAYAAGTRQLLRGQDAPIADAALSPDARLAASAGRDGRVLLWDVQTGTIVREFTGHADRVTSVAFSPDGNQLLTGSWDRTARIWDVATGSQVYQLRGHLDGVLAVAFSPGGRSIATASNDGTVRLWDAANGEERRVLVGHTAGVNSVTFDPDSQQVLSGSADQTARLWNVQTGRELLQLDAEAWVTAVAVHPNGRLAAVGTRENLIVIFDLREGEEVQTFAGHTDGLTAVVFAPDGRSLLSSSADGSMIRWNLETGQLAQRFLGHMGGVTSAHISGDGTTALTSSEDETVRVWEIDGGAELNRYRFYIDEVAALDISRDGDTVVSGGNDDSFILWSLASGTQINRFFGHEDSVVHVRFSPDGTHILSSALDKALIYWDTATAQPVRSLAGAHQDVVASTAFLSDGTQAISGAWDGTLALWSLTDGALVRRFTGAHEGLVVAVAVTPDDQSVLSASSDGTVVQWDIASGQVVGSFDHAGAAVTSIAITPDGSQFVSATSEGVLYLWDIATGEQVRQFVGHRSAVLTVALNREGTTLVSGSRDRSVILWDLASAAQIFRFERHEGAVTTLAYLPGSDLALSGSDDKTMRLWRTLPLNHLVEWTNTNRYVPALDCSPDSPYRVESLCDLSDAA